MMFMLIFAMKSISMVELRTDSERIVRELRQGQRLLLLYRGKPLAELVPTQAPERLSPSEALHLAQEQAAEYGTSAEKLDKFVADLRSDQRQWSRRSRT